MTYLSFTESKSYYKKDQIKKNFHLVHIISTTSGVPRVFLGIPVHISTVYLSGTEWPPLLF